MARSERLVDPRCMTEMHDPTDEERNIARRHERQGWVVLIGGFALAGCLVIAASYL
jgi:hypothetical protein